MGTSGVVDENIDATEPANRGRNQFVGRSIARDVRRERKDLLRDGAEFACGSVEPLAVSRSNDAPVTRATRPLISRSISRFHCVSF
jgi:hypothetical protein